MPEGNELHRHARRQGEFFLGKTVRVEAPNERFAEGAALLDRRKVRAVEAFGKHLFYDFGKARQLHVHLGLYGKFRDGEMPYPEPRGALRLRISDRKHWIELRGPTACEVIDDQARAKLLARIGPDPLRADAEAERAINRIAKSRAPMAGLLMDQAVISGIGNIYRAEFLFRARIDPMRPGQSVPRETLQALWQDAVRLMPLGMEDRRMVTTEPADRPHPKGRARRGETHYVYRRHGLPCFLCGTKIQLAFFLGRKLFWCPQCQK
jgi:endonuclease VIII